MSSGTSATIRSASVPRPSTVSRHRSSNSTRPTEMDSWSFSRREVVRRFSTSPIRRFPWRSIRSRNSSRRSASSANCGSRSVFAYPVIAVIGVRSSCETTATNSPFIRFSSRS